MREFECADIVEVAVCICWKLESLGQYKRDIVCMFGCGIKQKV